MKIVDSNLFHDFDAGMQGKEMEVSKKLYKQAKNFYRTVDESLPEDTVMYEVTSFLDPDGEAGHLNWGVSLLHPIRVQGECNMTRGHFHKNLNCEEYYWTSKGEGLLMLMDEEGNCWCEAMRKGSLHHIDGHHAHRLINTGDEDLEVICVWPGDAGHDYERIEKNPFPYRVFKVDEEIQIEERDHA